MPGEGGQFRTDRRSVNSGQTVSFTVVATGSAPLVYQWRENGVLISSEEGVSNAYGLFPLQERGWMFIGAGVKNYGGMLVGIHNRDNDLVVNVNKAKKLTNIRTTAADEKLILAPPRQLSLEMALEFINDDELVEVTPQSIRMRKMILDPNERKRSEKKPSAEA